MSECFRFNFIILPIEGCIPAKCGRAVVDQLFNVEESHRLLSIAKKAFVKAGSNGGASILDLHSGALSKVSVLSSIDCKIMPIYLPSFSNSE